jgi:hypothetical protein
MSKRDSDHCEPIAWTIFQLLRDRSPADRRFVFRAVAARLSAGPTNEPDHVGLCLNALAVCMDATQRTPSRRSYDDWRRDQPRPDEWPASTTIRNTFAGSWAKALDALGVEPAPDVLARRLLDIGKGYEREEIIAALRAYAEATTTDKVLENEYQAWARSELKNPERKLKRMPLSTLPIRRVFGSWHQALEQADLLDPIPRHAGRRRTAPRGVGTAYRSHELIASVRQAAESIPGQRRLTMPAYERWRQGEIDQALAGGSAKVIPSSQVVIKRFGSWPRALHQAELIDDEELALARQRGPRRLTDREVLDWLVTALSEAGRVDDSEDEELETEDRDCEEATAAPPRRELTRAEYRRWRHGRLRRARDPRERPVSDMLIYERVGDWALALDRANKLLGEGRSE